MSDPHFETYKDSRLTVTCARQRRTRTIAAVAMACVLVAVASYLTAIANARIVPVYLDIYGKPEFMTGSAASAILTRLKTIPAKHGTMIGITGDTAKVMQ